MKNLANCTPREFLKQTYRIKKCVEKWLQETDLLNIRKNVPVLQSVAGLEGEAKEKVIQANKQVMQKQVKENLMKMLDKVLDEHADDTIELLALCCFVEPEDKTLTLEIMNLPSKLKEAALLCWFHGMTYEEAAGTLGISPQAVSSRLNRARRKLRAAMEGSDEHDPA